MTIAYFVARPRQADSREFLVFREASQEVLSGFNGEIMENLRVHREGADRSDTGEALVAAFDTIAQARAFYESEEYAEIRKDRAS
ncbi:DUF1330 domain-containing protein [Shimia sp.]|uniref:DUF1330 domain-containing protein n=1 Tax=Shimia sp. TaxID=1954381 RepID=UPI003296E60E